jgi:signal transduction histidine kinase/CheY-like chemotaxis protein
MKRGLPPILANRRTIRAIYEDNQGRLWVGTANNGLYCRRGDTWTRIAPDVSARVIKQTRNGSLWMGTNGRGLFRYRNGEFDQVTPEDGLSSALVRAIHEDSTGALWIGTEDKGLNRIDRQGTLTLADDSIAIIRKSDGLFDNVISQILPDGHGRLWMSSNRGLFWARRTELHAVADGQAGRLRSVSYTEAEGLRNREANGGMQPAGIRASSGALWFPTQEGAVRIHPDSLSTNDVPPPIVIERIITDSTSHKASAPVQLPVGVRNFEVAFAGLKLSNPDALTFRYRLRGFEGQGPQVTERRRATYTNVPPGRYTFEVRARTDGGVRSPAPATVRIEIPSHWWETRWFYMLCGLGLLGVGLGAYQWRTRQLRRRQQELEETVAERTKQIRQKNDELAQQAEKLKELDEAKSRFFANLSHEFRTPLTLIRGPVQEVREHLTRVDVNLDEQAEQLAVVERNTDRLRRLVDQLLTLARMDAGSYELAARPTNLGAEVQRIAQAFAPLAERNDLTLTMKMEETEAPDPVVVDREALEHILGNLLSNAIKFTPEGGRVTVTVTDQGEHAAMTVADTGPGIPEDKQDTVFERFERTDEKQSGDQEGVGIGLAFANDLVDLHGGTIALDSAAGDGTRVTVRFPRGTTHLPDEHLATAPQEPDDDARPSSPTPDVSSSADGAPASHTPSSADDASPSDPEPAPRAPGSDEEPQRKVVLVVDDNADVRRYVRSILAPTYTVIEAAHGEEGLDQAREATPDCILADVMMPTMDGVTMVRHLKSDRATAHIPIVMLTARAGTEHEIEGLEAGADDYVTKPFDAGVLQARVAGMIEVRQRLRRRIRQELKRQSGDGQAGASSERAFGQRGTRPGADGGRSGPGGGAAPAGRIHCLRERAGLRPRGSVRH